MIDISSKVWRVRSNGHGGATIERLRDGETRTLALSDLPSVDHMAMLQERAFDTEIAGLFFEVAT